jgi:hypothetical protein
MVVSCLAVAAGGILVWQMRTAARTPSVTPSLPFVAPGDTVLGVETFMKAASRRHEVVRVEGVVSAVSANTGTFALIDLREFEACGLDDCALRLPVRWTGLMPSVREVVQVEGQVQETEGKHLFVASAIQKVTPQTEGTR